MNTELAIHYFENRHEIGDRIPGLEERLALDALERVAAGLDAPGWTRREAGWEDTDPSPVTVRGRFPPCRSSGSTGRNATYGTKPISTTTTSTGSR